MNKFFYFLIILLSVFLIFITARNISSRFFNFEIKKSTKVDYVFAHVDLSDV
ncbi:Uncharacterised protein [Staphylococcus aureus]|nr:Uncharacterised protein [Staphylococcus aureus]